MLRDDINAAQSDLISEWFYDAARRARTGDVCVVETRKRGKVLRLAIERPTVTLFDEVEA